MWLVSTRPITSGVTSTVLSSFSIPLPLPSPHLPLSSYPPPSCLSSLSLKKHRYEQVLKEKATDLKEEMSSLAFLRFKELCLKLSLTYGIAAHKFKVYPSPSPSPPLPLSFSPPLPLSPSPSHFTLAPHSLSRPRHLLYLLNFDL